MATFKTHGHKTCVFLFSFSFLFLSMAAFKKHGSSLPKAAFYRHGFKFSLKPCV